MTAPSRATRAEQIDRKRPCRTYPIDRWLRVVMAPLLFAKGRAWPLKLLLVLLYFFWFVLCLPITAPVLFLSLALGFWDLIDE